MTVLSRVGWEWEPRKNRLPPDLHNDVEKKEVNGKGKRHESRWYNTIVHLLWFHSGFNASPLTLTGSRRVEEGESERVGAG